MNVILRREPSQVEVGTGNVYEDLGYADAHAMLYKATIAMAIGHTISEKHLTQEAAALAINCPDLLRLLVGRFSKVSAARMELILKKVERLPG